jgi:hypothetical protein
MVFFYLVVKPKDCQADSPGMKKQKESQDSANTIKVLKTIKNEGVQNV